MTFGRRITEYRERRALEREANLRNLATVPAHRLHTGTYSGGCSGESIDKECASQSGPYMKAAKALGYCMNCSAVPTPSSPLEFCHADAGKGTGIKTDVREGWPGCHDCHSLFGGHNGGSRLPKEVRRPMEKELARQTRAAIIAAGAWPANLPMLKGETDAV